ncbi:MAG: FkbM family methyltransferase [Minisyncoccia bacterium]
MKTLKRVVKKLANVFGLDIVRGGKKKHPFLWFKDLEIKTIIDVGANVGQFANQVREVMPEVTIYSFEPVAHCFKELQSNMRGDANFMAFNCALGDEEKETQIYVNEYSPSSSLLHTTEIHETTYPFTTKSHLENISVKTLDLIAADLSIKDNLLIKLDVQGYEDRVILGGLKTIEKAKVLLVESSFDTLYEKQYLFDDLYEMLKKLGFTYHGSTNIERYKNNLPLFEDAIFIRNTITK